MRFVLLLLLGSTGLLAQHDVRSAARHTAELVVLDGGFATGTSVHVSVEGAQDAEVLREGLLEGLLSAGLVVLEQQGERDASLKLSFIMRGIDEENLSLSVVGSIPGEGRYVFSRGYVVPLKERSLFDDYLAPVMIVSAAVLMVYLLLTVRSS